MSELMGANAKCSVGRFHLNPWLIPYVLDPDSLEAGEALALERRIVRARRALEKSIAVLSEGARGAGRDEATLDGGAA